MFLTMVTKRPITWMASTAAALLLLLGVSPALAQSTTPVPRFVSGSATISLKNNTFPGRTTKIALTSPSNFFELALIQDGFGKDTKFQYCWTEIHDTATEKNLTWRAPCNPLRVDQCSLVLTQDGDFRLEVAAGGSPTTPDFLSGTGGQGVVDVRLTDQGNLLLVKADNSTVWQSSDHIQRQQKCREEFNSAPGRTKFAWFGLAGSILLTAILALAF